MGLWDDDPVDTSLLRPSPAVRRQGTASGRWDLIEAEADDVEEPAGREPAARRRTGPAGPRRAVDTTTTDRTGTAGRNTKRGVLVAVVVLSCAAALLAQSMQFLRPPARAAGTAAASQPQLPAPMGPSTLRRPLSVALEPAPARPAPCPANRSLRCGPPAAFLTVDEVRGVTAVAAGAGAALWLTLGSWDAATLATTKPGQRFTVRVGTAAPTPASYDRRSGLLVLPMRDRAAAISTLAATGVALALPPRTGPGPLTRPLELWTVTSGRGPCRAAAAAGVRGLLVVDRVDQCLQLRGPALRLRSVADLRLARPTGKNKAWLLTVTLTPADRPALIRLTREQALRRGRIAFVVGGRVVTGQPAVTGIATKGIELGFADEPEARLLIDRLRP